MEYSQVLAEKSTLGSILNGVGPLSGGVLPTKGTCAFSEETGPKQFWAAPGTINPPLPRAPKGGGDL